MTGTLPQAPECTSVMRQCVPFLDGELDPPLAGEVRGHLSRCEACRRYFEHERAFTASMQDAQALAEY